MDSSQDFSSIHIISLIIDLSNNKLIRFNGRRRRWWLQGWAWGEGERREAVHRYEGEGEQLGCGDLGCLYMEVGIAGHHRADLLFSCQARPPDVLGWRPRRGHCIRAGCASPGMVINGSCRA
jgi:hypothetical protein